MFRPGGASGGSAGIPGIRASALGGGAPNIRGPSSRVGQPLNLKPLVGGAPPPDSWMGENLQANLLAGSPDSALAPLSAQQQQQHAPPQDPRLAKLLLPRRGSMTDSPGAGAGAGAGEGVGGVGGMRGIGRGSGEAPLSARGGLDVDVDAGHGLASAGGGLDSAMHDAGGGATHQQQQQEHLQHPHPPRHPQQQHDPTSVAVAAVAAEAEAAEIATSAAQHPSRKRGEGVRTQEGEGGGAAAAVDEGVGAAHASTGGATVSTSSSSSSAAAPGHDTAGLQDGSMKGAAERGGDVAGVTAGSLALDSALAHIRATISEQGGVALAPLHGIRASARARKGELSAEFDGLQRAMDEYAAFIERQRRDMASTAARFAAIQRTPSQHGGGAGGGAAGGGGGNM